MDDDDIYDTAPLSTTGRHLFSRISRSTSRLPNSASPYDYIGPLGLNTLWEPQESVIADLIFVHGLGGGSRKTWTKDKNPGLFWPEMWLPQDLGFRDVRIHSFGYDSRLDHESILNIHDFSKSLLASIQNCPKMPRGCEVC